MLKKFNFVILLIILLFNFLSAEENKLVLSLIRQKIDYNAQIEITSKYLTDLAETQIGKRFNNIILKNLLGEISNYEMDEILKIATENGLNAFYLIKANIIKDSLIFNISLYDWQGKIINESKFSLIILKNNKIDVTEEKEKEWIEIFNSTINSIMQKKDNKKIEKIKAKINFKYNHDFPLIGISFSALSAKIYFDDRINSKIQKIFSLSPLDLRLSLYPLRYMETGVFCRFDFNNMVYNYYDKKDGNNKYFDSTFLFTYGMFIGVSFFKENIHFSFGGQVYNLFYDISSFPKWRKTNDINSYLLPQFSIYYKLDFKLFKYLYFTVFFNFKTLPKFELNNGFFYSKPFLYDSFCLEFSFVGLSVMF